MLVRIQYNHWFIPNIFIAPFKSTTTGTPRRSRLLHRYCVGVNTPKRYRQLSVKDLPKVPMWWLEWDLRLSALKALNLPLSHHAPQKPSSC